jgi:hypothetical protein
MIRPDRNVGFAGRRGIDDRGCTPPPWAAGSRRTTPLATDRAGAVGCQHLNAGYPGSV